MLRTDVGALNRGDIVGFYDLGLFIYLILSDQLPNFQIHCSLVDTRIWQEVWS